MDMCCNPKSLCQSERDTIAIVCKLPNQFSVLGTEKSACGPGFSLALSVAICTTDSSLDCQHIPNANHCNEESLFWILDSVVRFNYSSPRINLLAHTSTLHFLAGDIRVLSERPKFAGFYISLSAYTVFVCKIRTKLFLGKIPPSGLH